jgi:GNAT superfamily N-acetyltransferase
MDVIRLRASQKDLASQVLAHAFMEDPLMKFLVPEERSRSRILPYYLGTAVRYGLYYGEVYTTPGLEGVIGWLGPNIRPASFWRLLRTGMLVMPLKLGKEAYRRSSENEAFIEEMHRKLASGPHWYLWYVGVEPVRQGKGVGACLLEAKLRQADSTGLPCYLETHNPRNVGYYQKFGFEVAETRQVPGYSLQVWFMRREPRASGAGGAG